jgi:HEAT repeat protein
MLRHVPLMVILLFAGCAKNPERGAVNMASALLDEGSTQTALDVVDNYLRQHPQSVALLRMRVVVLLRQEHLEQAATALQQVPIREPLIAQVLRHHDRIVRENAAKFISTQPDASDFHELVRSLDDPDADVRRYCARALGRLGNPSALKPLFRLLSDDNWLVRAEAATALGKIGDGRAIGWLVQLLPDTDGYVRYSATAALYDLATESSRPLLLRAFESAGVANQFGIAIALARLHDPAAVEPLSTAVSNKDVETRRLAARALGECGLAAGTNALEILLRDADSVVREQAETAIGQIKKTAKE